MSEKKTQYLSLSKNIYIILKPMLALIFLLVGTQALIKLIEMGRLSIEKDILTQFTIFLQITEKIVRFGTVIWSGFIINAVTSKTQLKVYFGHGFISACTLGVLYSFILAFVTFVFKFLEGDTLNSFFYLISFLWKAPMPVFVNLIIIQLVLCVLFLTKDKTISNEDAST